MAFTREMVESLSRSGMTGLHKVVYNTQLMTPWSLEAGSHYIFKMRLTLHTDYALRILIYLGLRPGPARRRRGDRRGHGVWGNHLDKVVHRLGRGGFIETPRGRGGGLHLAMPADRIRIGDVVRRTEEDLALVVCFAADGRCGDIRERCALAGICMLQGALGRRWRPSSTCWMGGRWRICWPGRRAGRRRRGSACR